MALNRAARGSSLYRERINLGPVGGRKAAASPEEQPGTRRRERFLYLGPLEPQANPPSKPEASRAKTSQPERKAVHLSERTPEAPLASRPPAGPPSPKRRALRHFDLQSFAQEVDEAGTRRAFLCGEIADRTRRIDEAVKNLDRQEWPAISWLKRQQSLTTDASLAAIIEELHTVENQLQTCVVDADFETTDKASGLFAELSRRYSVLDAANSDTEGRDRPAPHNSRQRGSLGTRSTGHGDPGVGPIDTISSSVPPLRLDDASGTAIFIYPRFVAVLSRLKKPSLVDVRQVFVSARQLRGSGEDPAIQAGELQITLPDGLDRTYGFSDLAACNAFADAFTRYIGALPAMVATVSAYAVGTAPAVATVFDPSHEGPEQPLTAAPAQDAAAEWQTPGTDAAASSLPITSDPEQSASHDCSTPNPALQGESDSSMGAPLDDTLDAAAPELTAPDEASPAAGEAPEDLQEPAAEEAPLLEAGSSDQGEAASTTKVQEPAAEPQRTADSATSSEQAIDKCEQHAETTSSAADPSATSRLSQAFLHDKVQDTAGLDPTTHSLNSAASPSAPQWADSAIVAEQKAAHPKRDGASRAPTLVFLGRRVGPGARFALAAALSLAIAVAGTSPIVWRESTSPPMAPPTPIAAPSLTLPTHAPALPTQPARSVTLADSPPPPVAPVATPRPPSPPPTPAPGRPLTPREVVQLQRRLQALGFDPGPADGVIGRQTIGAAAMFRASSGEQATGQIDSRLLEAVLAARAEAVRPR